MSILAIDFGLKYIGLAISYNNILAEPLGQFSYKNKQQLFKKISGIIKKHKIKKIIIGISENKMAEQTKEFGQALFIKTKIPVEFQDETLSSKEALKKMIEAGAKQKKRQTKKHQVAASKILQDFLDENKTYC